MNKMKELFVMEHIPNKVNYWLLCYTLDRYIDSFEEYGVPNFFTAAMSKFEKGSLKIIFNRNEFAKAGKYVFNKILENPDWFDEYNKKVFELNKEFMRIAKKTLALNPAPLSDAELIRHLKIHFKAKEDAHFVGQPAIVLDFDTPFFSNYLLDYLKTKTNNANESFRILTTPTSKSFARIEEEELFKIAELIRKNPFASKFFKENTVFGIERNLYKINKEIDNKIHEHFLSFRWLYFMYEGPAYEKEYFIERLKEIISQNIQSKDTKKEFAEIRKQQEELIKKLNIDEKHKRLFELAKDTVFLKVFRKDCLFFGMYSAEELTKEIAKRLNIELKYVRYLLFDEIEKAFQGQNFKEIVKKRYEKSLYFSDKKGYKVLYDQEIEKILESLEEKVEDVSEIKGQHACSGTAKGKVKIINLKEDMSKMEKGDILVSVSTNPDLVPAMEKAAAFVTDTGGITSHAAIVAREMEKPCVIGTKIATKVLKDGDMVEVDAENGIVRKV
jgi:phosphohistidine swiveling domain-containing protein